jgi:hypothetical protein
MKKLIGLMAVVFAASPAYAEIWGTGNADVAGTVLHDLDKPAYMGTGLSKMGPKVSFYGGLAPDQVDNDFATGLGGPEKGNGNADEYGSILVEKGIRP